MSDVSFLKTPLHAWHVASGAKMAEFAGWDMPIQYSGIIAEHQHTRTQAGLFDICHMGEVMIEGPGVAAALAQAVTINIDTLKPGRCRYGFLLNEQGGILDDLIVYRLEENSFMLVVNAGCRAGDLQALQERIKGFTIRDISDETAKLDIQGPEAVAVMESLIPGSWRIPYFSCVPKEFDGSPLLVSRTGYTGELGFELYLPSSKVVALWELCLSDKRVLPVGLGARDTLRLEIGLPLNGHDIGPEYTPAEAGYTAMLTSQAEYVGKEGSRKITRKLTGLTLEGRRSARQGDLVLTTDGQEAGVVSSGSFSPSLGYSIALAYINADKAGAPGYIIRCQKADLPATVCSLPFYTAGTARASLV